MIFFCRGAIETVRKFGWSPDIIHCIGWMTSLVPMYLKTTYKNDPIFTNSKVLYTISKNYFDSKLSDNFTTQIQISDNITKKHLEYFKDADNTSLHIGGSEFADALVVEGTPDEKVTNFVKKTKNKLILNVEKIEDEQNMAQFSDFYQNVMAN